jgi:hypothetical protein
MAVRQVGSVKKINYKIDEISLDLSLTREGSLLKILLNESTEDLTGRIYGATSQRKSRDYETKGALWRRP